jgi:radical SAM superfamily enzyme YgiQ (UPF0313 family)
MKPAADPRIREVLLRVEKPARYSGGEFGSVRKEGALKVALSYPDLYEIGMSNQAIKILYGMLNRLDDVQCERLFAPANDMEGELRRLGLPLFSLESRLPLGAFDLIAFSVGYELNATTVLQILDCGGVPLRAEERGDGHPLVIGGGPGLINPAPFLPFFDFIYIGEAESWIGSAFRTLADMKKAGAGRADLAGFLETQDALASLKKPAARRAIWTGFGREEIEDAFPIASLKAAQDHGMIEIMRGCPNGCRFCNAGFLYRPFRVKPPEAIARQAYRLTFDFGYRELSLSSLSTGDYPGIAGLVRRLNRDFSHIGTSFSLPSLKIDSLSLDLFREINTVRKSGLTFAVESPCEAAQRMVNKTVSLEKTIALVREAKSLGWRQAKFYFMLGLPGYTETDESDLILDCLRTISRQTSIAFNVNLSTFVPKPHTPFQWSAQLTEAKADERIGYIRSRLPKEHFKIGYHDPFQSLLEGMITRGDERVATIIEQAFRAGARFDAWEEHVRPDIWRPIIAEAGWDAAGEAYRARGFDELLPWEKIDMGIKRAALVREARRAERGELTSPCAADCLTPCGVCGEGITAGAMPEPEDAADPVSPGPRIEESLKIIGRNETHRVLFAFRKTGNAAFLSHLNIMTVFERALLRAGYYCRMTGGFNPKPIMEFANPLPLGFESHYEVASVDLFNFNDVQAFCSEVSAALPEGLIVFKALELPVWRPGDKKMSLMAKFWGGDYLLELGDGHQTVTMPASPELLKINGSIDAGRFALRFGGTEKNSLSFRKYLDLVFSNENYLEYCKPVRLMTLASGKDNKPVNFFKLF